jgi:carboxymethylenebutenolidase
MWNQFRTDEYQGMMAETVTMTGYNGDQIHAYFSKPLGEGPFPGVVLIPHMPGWDEWYREATRRFTHHGYLAICPDIYCRFGHGTVEEVMSKVRDGGGVPDDNVIGDFEGAAEYLRNQPDSNNKIGIIGTCSSGRQAFLLACRAEGIDAAVDCWGGGVIASEDQLTPARPVAPIDYTEQLSCPLLGIFGNEDRNPTPEHVDTLEAELKKFGKDYEFHRYDGAGHAFWSYDRAAYRPEQAMDAWNKVFEFFGKHLSG